MWFSRKQVTAPVLPAQLPLVGTAATAVQPTTIASTKSRGDAAEQQACAYLQRAGMTLLTRNFRTPGRGGGEIDLVMRAADGTLVFVEVRQRASASHGGASGSISAIKQRRIVFAAKHYLMRYASMPPCRFDVVLVQGGATSAFIEWLPAAFDAS